MFVNIFTDPAIVFEELKKTNYWKLSLMPLIILMVLGAVSLLLLKDLYYDVQLEQAIKWIENSSQIPEDQKEDAPANAAGGGGVAGIGVGADGEPGIRPDAANKYKKKNKDEFKSRIMKFLKNFKTVKEDNEMRASEIASQASNDSEFYRRQIQPNIKNLRRKKFKGE